jgi:hypothetical protein
MKTHPDFKNNNNVLDYDYAIIRLKDEIDFHDKANAICLNQ